MNAVEQSLQNNSVPLNRVSIYDWYNGFSGGGDILPHNLHCQDPLVVVSGYGGLYLYWG